MPRLFVAIDLPDAIKQQLLDLQTHIPTARWAKSEQMHLTLRFIGEVADEQVEPIKSSLATVTASPFDLTLRHVGHFPPGKRTLPRVLWVGMDQQPALNDLHQQIESALSQLDFKPDNKLFSPHITLARLKLNRPARQVDHFLSKHEQFNAGTFTATEFRLYSSLLMPQGAVYTVERSFQW
jgi:2'-5' RNA ligase